VHKVGLKTYPGSWLYDSDAAGHRVVDIEWMTRFLSSKWLVSFAMRIVEREAMGGL
jgi:hypothetical protein